MPDALVLAKSIFRFPDGVQSSPVWPARNTGADPMIPIEASAVPVSLQARNRAADAAEYAWQSQRAGGA